MPGPIRSSRLASVVVLLAMAAVGCGSGSDADTADGGTGGCRDAPPSELGSVDNSWAGPGPTAGPDSVWPTDPRQRRDHTWAVEILAEVPHDRAAFTQGLEFHDGRILESTGCRGRSELREVDATTGAVVRRVELPESQFGEGLTVVGNEIVQLTWQAGVARRLAVDTFAPVGEFTYDGEGWGVCASPGGLVMSNGTATLTHRAFATFEVTATVEVTRDGEPVRLLNELECIDDLVLANVWRTDEIVVIDPDSGEVLATIDATEVHTDVGVDTEAGVLNGIAAVGDGTLLLGGKHWPRHYIVRLTAP